MGGQKECVRVRIAGEAGIVEEEAKREEEGTGGTKAEWITAIGLSVQFNSV